jgi:hypothetical protein
MGVFDVMLVGANRVVAAPLRNTLFWPGQDRLLRKMFPTQDGELSYTIGFSGPMYRDYDEVPNYDGATFTWDRRLALSDVQGNSNNEGGHSYADRRAIFGYERKAITWGVSRDGMGAIATTQWASWTSQVSWSRHGDWTPDDWPEENGPYPQPYKWADCEPYEGDHGYPWCYPRIHDDWWEDNELGDDELGVECASCVGILPHALSGFPVGCVFVVVSRTGSADALLAAALFVAPAHWRMGGTIRARYRLRCG